MKQTILFLALVIFSGVVFGQAGPGAIFQGANILMLKQNQIFKNSGVKIMTGDTDDPTVVAKSADQGSLYIREGTGILYKKADNGLSLNWQPLLIGPVGSGTDECVARWDGTGVPLLQNSIFCITDAGVGSGLTQFNLENLRLDLNTLSSTNANGDLNLSPNGTGRVVTSSPVVIGPTSIYGGDRGTGSTGTFYGATAGSVAQATALSNTGIGSAALEDLSTGDQNTAVGVRALGNNTTGSTNIAIGDDALRDTTTASGNLAIGSRAMQFYTGAAGNNIAIGNDAGFNLTTAQRNVIIGHGTMGQNLIGNGNTVVGIFGASPMTGGLNSVFGEEAMGNCTTGSSNVAIGYNAGYNCGTTSSSIFIGANAGATGASSNKFYLDNTDLGASSFLYGDLSTNLLTINDNLIVSGLTASLPIKTNGSKQLVSAAIDLASGTEVSNKLPITNVADGTANQLIGADAAGTSNEFKTIQGTANQATVTHGVGTVTVGTVQDIGTGSSPTHVGMTLSGLSASLPVKTDGSKNLASGAINLASATETTGTTPEIRGGTGQATYATGDTLYASGANTLSKRAIGSSGDVLTVSGGVPVWSAPAAAGVTTIGTIDSVGKSHNGAVISATSLIMQTASATFEGIVSIIAQSFAGLKTFADGIVDSTLTSTRCLFAGTSGRISDDAGCTYSSANDEMTIGSVVTNSTTRASIPASVMTNVQKLALTPSTGGEIYNSTRGAIQAYNGALWMYGGSADMNCAFSVVNSTDTATNEIDTSGVGCLSSSTCTDGGAGITTCTFATNYWSSNRCVASDENGGSACSITSLSTGSVQVTRFNITTHANANGTCTVSCYGKIGSGAP